MRRDPCEAEIEEIEQRYHDGEISLEERNKQIRFVERWYRNEALDRAEEAAREAYERELERW